MKLRHGNPAERADALGLHALAIAEYLVPIHDVEIPEMVWNVAELGLTALDGVAELVDLAKVMVRDGPYAILLGQQKLVVNTLCHAGGDLFEIG
jgi:hypothetical protein